MKIVACVLRGTKIFTFHIRTVCIGTDSVSIMYCVILFSDVAIFVLKRDVKLQPTNLLYSRPPFVLIIRIKFLS